MRDELRRLKEGLIILFIINCFYGCTAPEERVEQHKEAPVPKVHTVVIQQMKFTPADLTVSEGDTVTWINRDIVDHNVTEKTNKEWSSSNLHPGKSWSMVVKKSAAYLCTIHPVMTGNLHIK